MANKRKPKPKQATEKIAVPESLDGVRKFILLYVDGEFEIFAKTRVEARIQAEEFLSNKGLSYKKDTKDFFEVKL